MQELQCLQNEKCTFIGAMTEMENSSQPWTGKTGPISRQMLPGRVPDLIPPLYDLAGPARIGAALGQFFQDLGVNPDNIRSEEFAGY